MHVEAEVAAKSLDYLEHPRVHQRAVHALCDTLGMMPPLASRAYLVASVERRNPHLDVLSHTQIEALRRRRAGTGDAERLTRIVFTTIRGIAAGLQTAG